MSDAEHKERLKIKGHGWEEFQLPEAVVSMVAPGTRAFKRGPIGVLLSQEPRRADALGAMMLTPAIEGLVRERLFYHLSISHPHRWPTWEEILEARETLLPLGLTFAQILPPASEYVNIHPNCFHLWEIDWHGS